MLFRPGKEARPLSALQLSVWEVVSLLQGGHCSCRLPSSHLVCTGEPPQLRVYACSPLPLQLEKSLWEVVNLLQEQKRRRALLLGFSRSPVDFIQSMVATQGRELRSLKLNQYTELEAVRCAGCGCSACRQNRLACTQLQQAACAFIHSAAVGCYSH